MIKNINALDCFKILKENKKAKLIDVRTAKEWWDDGYPDLTAINKHVCFITRDNSNFADDVVERGFNKDDILFFICRSGVRSFYAISDLINYFNMDNMFNVDGGIEQGWKIAGLPIKYS